MRKNVSLSLSLSSQEDSLKPTLCFCYWGQISKYNVIFMVDWKFTVICCGVGFVVIYAFLVLFFCGQICACAIQIAICNSPTPPQTNTRPKPQLYKTVILLGFCRNMAGVPQSQPKSHKKSHKNHQSPKKWDFFMNK